MFVQLHFVLKLIWNFYEANFYYSDTGFLPFRCCFGMKRHLQDCWLFSDVARNVRRNLSEEVDHSGLLSTLSWIFNWRVPPVKHPHPMDVALNNYAHYAKSRRRQRLPKPSAVNKWSPRKRKRIPVTHRNSFQHRSSQLSNSSPYKFEEPLDYFDASQVYFEPSQK